MNENCAGCKWLDHVKKEPAGTGYCCMVVRSSEYRTSDDLVRTPQLKRCELYEPGDFKTRYDNSDAEENQ